MKIIAAAFIALLTTFPFLQAIQKNIEIKRQEFFFDAKAWLPAKSFSSQNDELCTVTHRKTLNLKLSLKYNSQSQELLIENTGGGSVKYPLKEKLAQLPAVDMQLAFVHKGNLHVNCRQLIEFFFQCTLLETTWLSLVKDDLFSKETFTSNQFFRNMKVQHRKSVNMINFIYHCHCLHSPK